MLALLRITRRADAFCARLNAGLAAFAIVLALLAVGTLTHMLLTSLRQRRRDLAMLKTLGLLRSQLLQVVSWQASALAAAALLAGLPLGVLAGRWAWVLFARSIGVGPDRDASHCHEIEGHANRRSESFVAATDTKLVGLLHDCQK